MVTVMVAARVRLFADALARCLDLPGRLSVVHHGQMDGDEVVRAYLAHRPDVAVIDHRLRAGDGLESVRAIRQRVPGARLVLLAWYPAPEDVQAALAAGAAGFLPTGTGVDRLVEAVLEAHRGRPLVFPDQVADLAGRLSENVRVGDELSRRLAGLGELDLQILRLLDAGRTTKQAARDLGLSVGTVRNHLTTIFAATGARTRVEAIDRARAMDLIPARPRPGR